MEVWSDRGRGSRQLHSFRWIPETVERPPLEVRPGSAAPPPPPRDVEAASTVRFPKLRVTCKRKILHRVNAQGTLGSTSAHLTDTNLLKNLIHEKKVQTRRRTSWGLDQLVACEIIHLNYSNRVFIYPVIILVSCHYIICFFDFSFSCFLFACLLQFFILHSLLSFFLSFFFLIQIPSQGLGYKVD